MFVLKGLTLPCFATIFPSVRKAGDGGYESMSDEIEAMVNEQPGFLGLESVREPNGNGITVCYWKSIDDIKRWKDEALHREAQERGRLEWYAEYGIRIVEIKETYDWH
ncbi:MAG: antibiotic biosynthesis monooxygenase [Bacteroidetes bacterium]|nr:antibiotic biosynthesis monooxygenase [Bacteroidota bacterium]